MNSRNSSFLGSRGHNKQNSSDSETPAHPRVPVEILFMTAGRAVRQTTTSPFAYALRSGRCQRNALPCLHSNDRSAALGARATSEVHVYVYAIPTGCMSVRPCKQEVAACELWLNEGRVAHFGSAAAAAAAVSERRTGCAAIDGTQTSLPANIDAWRWVSVHGFDKLVRNSQLESRLSSCSGLGSRSHPSGAVRHVR